MNRADFQQLTEIRIAEAHALLNQGLVDGAYYLAGYAVECALKACIAKLTNQYDFPDKPTAERSFSHDIEKLLDVARLRLQRDAEAVKDPEFLKNWQEVKDWNESSRYVRNAPADAQALYHAITDPAHGVLTWIKLHW